MRKKFAAGTAALITGALTLSACSGGGPSASSGALTDDKIVLAVLNDASGVYKDLSGPNSVTAVEMAVADFLEEHGEDAVVDDIEVISADHQNEPDIANSKAQELYDREGADVILDVPSSAAALAVANQAKTNKKLYINVGAGTSELTGAQCNKYTFHWAYDTYMLAKGTASALTEQGGKTWSIVYPDYEFGQTSDELFTQIIEDNGGKVLEHIPTPFPNDNFATFLTKAGSQNPDVIASMHGGGDLINFIKQYNQSGLAADTTLAAGVLFITDIHSLGVDQFVGTTFTDAWYWNMDDKARAFADRFQEETGTRPSSIHAGNYSAAKQYLTAVQEEGTDDADAIVGHLEGKKVEDMFLRNGEVRAEDHRVIHDVSLARVKEEADVTEEWDYEEILTTIPAEEAFRPVEESNCTM